MIKVQVVDDSVFIRKSLKKILESDGEFILAHESSSVEEAISNFRKDEPDLIICDIQLYHSNGLDFIKWVMTTTPKPIIVLSGEMENDDGIYYQAVELGVIDVIRKDPKEITGILGLKTTIINSLQSVYKKKPVKREEPITPLKTPSDKIEGQLILVGSSTGGPQAIENLLKNLLPEISFPIMIVQHMPVGFTESFANRLNMICKISVQELSQPTELKSGHAYIAKAGYHMNVKYKNGKLTGVTSEIPRDTLHKPSVDELFYSGADASNILIHAFLLTGMGSDGAKGLLALRKNGHKTFTQLSEECIVDGMPRMGREMGGSMREMKIDEMSQYLSTLRPIV